MLKTKKKKKNKNKKMKLTAFKLCFSYYFIIHKKSNDTIDILGITFQILLLSK